MKIYNISIVIVEYLSLNDIKIFLYSIEHLKNIKSEIIISSNSLYSKHKQTELQDIFPNLTWIFNDFNGGFGYAMNQGLKIASGDYIIITNPDVRLKSSLINMITFFEENKRIGAISPKIIDENGFLQDSFRRSITLPNFIFRNLKRLLLRKEVVLDYHNYYTPLNVDWLIGAFIVIRKEIYEKVGGFDENYFLYCEDMDWCTRTKKAGYDIVYFPYETIVYKGTRAARRSMKYMIIFIKSLFRYWNKFGYFFN